MRTTLPPARARRVGLLYAGLALFVLLAGLTARSVWTAWQERAGQARTATVFALVQQRMPSRPIEAPGAIAWLREQMSAYRRHLPPSDALTFERLADETDRIPHELVPRGGDDGAHRVRRGHELVRNPIGLVGEPLECQRVGGRQMPAIG